MKCQMLHVLGCCITQTRVCPPVTGPDPGGRRLPGSVTAGADVAGRREGLPPGGGGSGSPVWVAKLAAGRDGCRTGGFSRVNGGRACLGAGCGAMEPLSGGSGRGAALPDRGEPRAFGGELEASGTVRGAYGDGVLCTDSHVGCLGGAGEGRTPLLGSCLL